MILRLAAVFAAALALAGPAAAACAKPHTSLAALEGEIMCPTCHTTLDQSSSPIADRMRAFISARIAAGDTKSEIKAKLVAQFGPGVLAEPAKHGFDLLAWVLPLLALGLGAAVIGVLVVRWSRSRDPAPDAGSPEANGRVQLDPVLEKRLDDELARFE